MAVVAALGSIVSGFAAMSQAGYQAAVAKANAKQARLNANLAEEVAGKDAEDIGRENKGLMGELLAGQAASGLSIGSPSAVRSRIWMSKVAYQDQVRRVEAGNREAANYRTQANVFDTEAKAAKTSGMFSMIGGFIGGASSLVGSSQPSSRSPGFLPVPAVRAQIRNPTVRIGALY